MNEYEITIKTVDGQTHKLEVEDETAEMAAFWINGETSTKWIEYPSGTKTEYISKDKIVSFEVVDKKAEQERQEQLTKDTLDALDNLL